MFKSFREFWNYKIDDVHSNGELVLAGVIFVVAAVILWG